MFRRFFVIPTFVLAAAFAAPRNAPSQPALDELFGDRPPQPFQPQQVQPEWDRAGQPGAEWTILIYIGGDNNLDPAGMADIQEMEKVGSTDQVKVVCLFDREEGWRTARRALILQKPEPGVQSFEPSLPTCDDIGEVNTGDPKTLADFVKWGAANHPARHYFLILWNHGGGWRDLRWEERPVRGMIGPEAAVPPIPAVKPIVSPAYRAICFDDSSDRDGLYTSEVREALESTGLRFDIVGCDACLMGMIEVAYELKDLASIFLASEESIPKEGWEYTSLLQAMTRNPQIGAEQVCRVVMDGYQQFYEANGEEVTLSAIRLSAMPQMLAAIDAVCVRVAQVQDGRASVRPILESARGKAGTMDGRPFYVDIGGFVAALKAQSEDPTLSAVAGKLWEVYSSAVFCNYSRPNAKGTGLTIFFPETRSAQEYSDYTAANIRFARDSFWDEFIRFYAEGQQLVLPIPGPTPGPRPGILEVILGGQDPFRDGTNNPSGALPTTGSRPTAPPSNGGGALDALFPQPK